MSQQTYLPVNWADGMKVNKSHFIAQDNARVYQAAQGLGSVLHDHSYGLLPLPGGSGGKLKMSLTLDNQQSVNLRIGQCHAITRGGYCIQVDEDARPAGDLSAPLLHLSVPFGEMKGRDSSFLAVVTVNPYERNPFGPADPGELPPRLPFALPSLNLSLLPEQEAARHSIGLFQLVVGRVRLHEQKAFLDPEYIPPCASVSSHPDLVEIQSGLEQFYGKMELYSLQIIQKILQKKQANEMADIVRMLCEKITVLTAAHLTEIRMLSLHEPPAYLMSKPVALARLTKNVLDYYIGSGKEELVNYCTEWCDVSQAELEGSITALASHQYNHLDIGSGIEKISRFTKTLSQLFAALARLEYIGKRRESGIFVKEEVVPVQQEAPVRKRGSFLAD